MRSMFLLLLGCMLLIVTMGTRIAPLPQHTMATLVFHTSKKTNVSSLAILPNTAAAPHKPSSTPTPTPTTSPLPLHARDYFDPLRREGYEPRDYSPRKTPTPTTTKSPTTTPPTTPTAMATMPPIANNVPAEPVRMVIDAIGLDQPIFAVGLDADQRPIVLKHAVGWYHYSAMPGTGENVVLWGHVLRFRDSPDIAAPFANLHHVAVGTPIVLTTANGTSYTYVVIEHIYATPNQVDYILPQGQEMLTLVSCIGEQIITETSVEMSHRLITRALPMP